MTRWIRSLSLTVAGAALVVAGCTTPRGQNETVSPPLATGSKPSAIVPVRHEEPAELPAPKESPPPRPAYAHQDTLPIDLPTVIRMVDANSPTIGIARARVREAEARLDQAEVLWLPNLSIGSAYMRYDGQTQNQRGEVFGVSRANLFAGAGPALSLDIADAIYRPLIERRSRSAAEYRSTAVVNAAELEAVAAYLDLLQVHALIEINADTLKRAEAMLQAAQNAKAANLDRTAGDVQRARTEVLLRQAERRDLDGRAGAAGARLARLLLLESRVRLVPADAVIAPVTLIDATRSLDDLVQEAIAARPDLAAHRESLAAAWERVRRLERGPFLPKVIVANATGAFGGGRNDDLQDFESRNALGMQLTWELKNLGLGNRAEIDEGRAQRDQAHYQLVEAQARAMAEIVEAAQHAAARLETLHLAREAVREATELYRISREGTFNVVDAKNLFDALRPLQAIQALNQARQVYLAAVIEHNRAQYQLFTLLGRPTRDTLVQPAAAPTQTEVVPPVGDGRVWKPIAK